MISVDTESKVPIKMLFSIDLTLSFRNELKLYTTIPCY